MRHRFAFVVASLLAFAVVSPISVSAQPDARVWSSLEAVPGVVIWIRANYDRSLVSDAVAGLVASCSQTLFELRVPRIETERYVLLLDFCLRKALGKAIININPERLMRTRVAHADITAESATKLCEDWAGKQPLPPALLLDGEIAKEVRALDSTQLSMKCFIAEFP